MKEQPQVQDKKLPLSLILSIGFFGVVLVFAGGFFTDEPVVTEVTTTGVSGLSYTTEDQYLATLEERITHILSTVAEVGKTEILVTLKSSQEYVYAQETTSGYDGTTSIQEYILVDGQEGKEALVLLSLTPKIQGVVVVCDGGSSPVVQERISNILSTALGIGYSQISVQQRAIS